MLCVLLSFAAIQRVAFCSGSDIYVINIDGTGFKQITKSPAEDHDPTWSPDGSTIAFTRIPGHKPGEERPDGHLCSVRPDGSHLTQLTSGPAYDNVLSWAPGGITFLRQDSSGYFCRLDPKTKRVTKIGDPEEPGSRSPDGTEIVFKQESKSGDRLCVKSLSTGKVRVLVSGPKIYLEDARWSPDGKSLCFLQANEGQEPMTNSSFRQLYVIARDGSNKRRLTDHWGDDYLPQWTRDGQSILIAGTRGMKQGKDGISGAPTNELILVSAFGKSERVLPTGLQCYSPALSP